jgi:hypothetical protein
MLKDAGTCNSLQNQLVPPQGLEHTQESSGNSGGSEDGGATVGATAGEFQDERLATIVKSWSDLPETVKDELYKCAIAASRAD